LGDWVIGELGNWGTVEFDYLSNSMT